MSVRINLEIGHEASVRTKYTPEGFTHDWEVFVRGCDNANIQQYVEKVVFYLHDTFKNPKRVVKEPPYTVKESGYAGFILLIEVHLRTKEEPKKLKFNYDITLQKSGPAIYKFRKEKYVFNAPSEEFKQKLLKGGGIVVKNTQESGRENRTPSEEKSQLVSKPRLGGPDYLKKHKPKIDSNNFQELFGTPITKTSKPVETKPVVKDKAITKPGSSEKEKIKYSPYKEKEKDRDKYKEKNDVPKKDKDEKRKDDKKERSKDREKKERREKSPRSPTPSKRLPSPKRPTSPPIPKFKEKDEKKQEVSKKITDDNKEKSEKKIKREKRDKEKERHESKRKDIQKIPDQKEKIMVIKERSSENTSPVPPKPEKKDKINLKDFIKETENGKIKPDKIEEKLKHKHKKKDKGRDKLNEKDKPYKSDKKNDKEVPKDMPKQVDKQPSLFDSPKDVKKPEKSMHLVLPDIIDSDSSDSSISSPETAFNGQSNKTFEHQPVPPLLSPHPPSPPIVEPQKVEKPKKEKTKKNKDKKIDKDGNKKRKRKSEQKQSDEPPEKVVKEEHSNLNNNIKESDSEGHQDIELRRPPERRVISESTDDNCDDYMNVLRDLQQKILTLQDNSELQKVVELIAETGRYEVSAQTFDFDLCLLERSTILQLQHFFETTS